MRLACFTWVADIFWKGHFLERSFFGKGHYLDPKKDLSKKCTFPKNGPFQKIAISKKWPCLKKFITASKSEIQLRNKTLLVITINGGIFERPNHLRYSRHLYIIRINKKF